MLNIAHLWRPVLLYKTLRFPIFRYCTFLYRSILGVSCFHLCFSYLQKFKAIIHENVICQLFGTAVEYKIKNKDKGDCKVVPMFITTTEMSPTATEFANRLGVVVLKIPIGDYPMIKCNINNGERIYHLPFDQQYHRTRINNEGEFYAMTVEEATRKGFRRAMRHFVN